LDELFVSIDASCRTTYEKIRAGLSYDTLIQNLFNFIALNKKLNGILSLLSALSKQLIILEKFVILFASGKAKLTT